MQIQSELKSKLSEIEGHLLQGTTAGDVTGAKYDIIWRIILQWAVVSATQCCHQRHMRQARSHP